MFYTFASKPPHLKPIAHYAPQHEQHAPLFVANLVESGLNQARYYAQQQLFLLQELYLKRTLDQLVNFICDPLADQMLRQHSLNQLYKPQLALKRFYKQHHKTLDTYYALEKELRVLCHEFNPYH